MMKPPPVKPSTAAIDRLAVITNSQADRRLFLATAADADTASGLPDFDRLLTAQVGRIHRPSTENSATVV